MEGRKKDNFKELNDDFFEFESFLDDYLGFFENKMDNFIKEWELEKVGETLSFMHGISVKQSPDNEKNTIDLMDPPEPSIHESGWDEPLTDIIVDERDVKVIAELPGARMEDIDLRFSPGEISIKIDRDVIRYHKKIKLPVEVDAIDHKTSYKNGVLEISVKRPKKRKPKINKNENRQTGSGNN